ncbi:class I SAM-dependent methyltransferase [Paenibacillus radicis (ex Xue et al. 2023)]|uniref:Methyltransferase domain-containing protein n=1 Tax=Paenibacillus radicis (ex Xue et al. 2023) TaxID=2972489 RepID=A0ABT1Y922_9BACL|nr:methyltransferase domain-containing protein [Paenibacillus radicis (ex Xue et al. 2023)]MCR8629695.1 methyltransferase domain-containing protein [Paenibacillus radicis (ex Xue et al. 2023)]
MLLNMIEKSIGLDRWLFLKKFFQNPRDIGSIIPSSTSLTQKMLEPVRWGEINSLVELGAGTGVFTEAIHASKRPDCKVVIFEKDDEMRGQLQSQYSEFNFCKNAVELKKNLSDLGIDKVDCIISGLPFANFTQSDRSQIISQIKETLHEDGVFVTFQYSLQMKKMLQEEFAHMRIYLVPWNVPSAFVYVCRLKTTFVKHS